MLQCLDCCVFCREGIALAANIDARLAQTPWQSPDGIHIGACRIHAPARLAHLYAGSLPFANLRGLMADTYADSHGYIFIGAAGIAVRAIAPFLRHKSVDPPVVCLDSAGRFVISLLSGHWGGANSLTRHLAERLDAIPVITTASDVASADSESRALDLHLRKQGLKILDWQEVAHAQALVLDGQCLPLADPWHLVDETPFFFRTAYESKTNMPFFRAHWRSLPRKKGIIRITRPVLHIGIGCRKNTGIDELVTGFFRIIHLVRIEKEAIAALATVTAKEAQISELGTRLGLPVNLFAPEQLARIATPNPSKACGRRFGQKAFSVCEAAAIQSAKETGRFSGRRFHFLLSPKIVLANAMTFAVAIGGLTHLDDCKKP